ncbi:MAG: FtsQ-type POTRA domain-containing protein [Polyangia bacterium]
MSFFRRDNRPNKPRRKAARNHRRSDGRARSTARFGDAGDTLRRGLSVAAVLAKLGGVVAAAAVAVWGGYRAYLHATTADYFAVERIEIEGERRLTDAEVLAAGGLEVGTNVFKVDTASVAAALREHPWIAEAEVERRLPRSVSIEVIERRAGAMVLFDVPYLVDDAGEIFKRWAPKDPSPTPLITGFAREQLRGGEQLVEEGIRDALALARRYESTGLDRIAPLAEIHAEVDGGFSLTAGEDPFYVYFGKGPYRSKLRRLAQLLSRMRDDGVRPAVVYFDNEVRPDRVTVKTKPPKESSAADRRAELTGEQEVKKTSKI